jgi:hypothetical protein
MMPKRLRAQATRLGVTGNVDKLLKELHTIAVQHALCIMHERRAKEKQTAVTTNPKKKTGGTQTSTHSPFGLQRTRAPPR